jgi:hypothetical protein
VAITHVNELQRAVVLQAHHAAAQKTRVRMMRSRP